MYKIAVMGDRESICGFACLGFEVFFINEKDEAIKKLKFFAQNDYAIVYLTEALAEKLEDEIDKYKDSIVPAIVLIPGISGNTGKGMENLLQMSERAVGSKLL